jgi:hypothetical protein
MPLLIVPAVIAGALALGYTVDKTGEGIKDASNGLIKLAIVGAALYYFVKKA